MMPGYEGRERQWDFTLNDYPFTVYRPRGVPAWRVAREPDIAGQGKGGQAVAHPYRSTHAGFGWGQMLAENTYHFGNPADGRYPMGSFCGPLVYSMTLQGTGRTAVTGFVEKGSILYAVAGKWVNKITLNAAPASDAVASTGGWPYDLTTGNSGAVGTVGVEFDGNIVFGATIASGASMTLFDGTNFTVMNGANVPEGAYLVKYYGDTDYQIATCALISSTPSAAWAAQGATLTTGTNWSGYAGDYGIGDTSGSFTGLAAVERTLFPAMNDGLYYIDGRSGRAPRIITAVPRDSNNGVNTFADSSGRIWYPTKAGLLLYDPASGTIDDITPGRALPNDSGIIGHCTAFAQFRAWTYTAVYDGTDSYIMAGRPREQGEPGYGSYVWHGALVKISSDKVTSMHISSLVSVPRLLFGLNSGDVKSILLPSNGDNPLSDSSASFAASGSLYFGADDLGQGGMYWNLETVVCETEMNHANSTVKVYDRRDLGSWTQIGSTITTSGRTVITPAADKRFSRLELRFDLVNGVSTSTPVVRVLTPQALPRPSLRNITYATVVLDDEALSRMGVPIRSSAAELATALATYDSGAVYTLKHHWTGTEVSETVEVVSFDQRMAYQEDAKAAVYLADVVFKVLA